MNRLRKEYEVFRSCSHSMRVLLVANMIYGFVLPVIDIFVAAYVMRNTHDVARVVSYPLAMYLATPIAFYLNGKLLRHLGVKHLYAIGILLSGVAIIMTMELSELSVVGIMQAGFVLGLATGLFWANRQFLVLGTTTNENRNYYYGVELFVGTLASVVVPAIVGWFISGTMHFGWMGGVPNRAYHVVAIFVLALSVLSAAIVERGEFPSPHFDRFVYFKFNPLWWRMILLAFLKGLAQGYILAMPAMLVMQLVGFEGMLGLIESLGGILTAAMLYIVGRTTAPSHRRRVFAAGLVLFLAGSLMNSLLFDVIGVLVFQLCLVLAKPLLDLAYWPIELHAIDVSSQIDGRSRYAYLLHHEMGLLTGRVIGCGLMIVVAVEWSGIAALRYAMPFVALIQLLSIPVAQWLARGEKLALPEQ